MIADKWFKFIDISFLPEEIKSNTSRLDTHKSHQTSFIYSYTSTLFQKKHLSLSRTSHPSA